jgi:putative cardiolipin synthase
MRSAHLLQFAGDFARLNRRMHNKSFTADNQASVIGGRNVGNEYFGAGGGTVFADLDVVAVGDAVRAISRQFDAYWNSASAYPAAAMLGSVAAAEASDLEARFAQTRANPVTREYVDAVRVTPIVSQLENRTLPLEWTTATLVYDDPAKTLDPGAGRYPLLFPDLLRKIGRPERTLDLVSPYFVPGASGTAALVDAAKRGVRVRILTNSLSSSDVSAVHAGYAKRRVELLRAGVVLYELKATRPREGRDDRTGVGSSGAAALHAKTFAADDARIFVGSFNLDQRSAHLNTEMGLVIDSPTLARRLSTAFDEAVPTLAYEVRLAPDGGLEWIERTADGLVRHTTEPQTSWWLRSRVEFLQQLPIEWLL